MTSKALIVVLKVTRTQAHSSKVDLECFQLYMGFSRQKTDITDREVTKPRTSGFKRNPALTAEQENSVPGSHGDMISPPRVSCRDFYQLAISGIPFQRLSYIKYPKTFIKLRRDS